MALVTTGLTNGGLTTHYQIKYDDSLSSADGKDRANALIGVCEGDFDIMAGWFSGITLTVGTPIEVDISPGPYASAGWGPPIRLTPGNGSGLDVVRYILVAEVVEMFMLAQNKGWFAPDGSNEGAAGEGLSRFLSAEFLSRTGLGHNLPGFDTAGLWLNSDRSDFVNNIDVYDHAPDAKIGCATLFIYYLSYQLGYDIGRIIAGAASTLGGVYRNLTGDTADPFPEFKRMLDAAFPRTKPDGTPINSVIPGPNPDNPYPLETYTPEVPVTARLFWKLSPGRNLVNVNWGAISADSVVVVTVSEYSATSQKLPDGTHQRFIGAADISVANVTPHGPPFDSNHGVTFVVEVNFDSPLMVCTDVTVLDNAPAAVVFTGPDTGISTRSASSAARTAVQTQIVARTQPEYRHAATVR